MSGIATKGLEIRYAIRNLAPLEADLDKGREAGSVMVDMESLSQAFVLTTAERARDLKQDKPVHVRCRQASLRQHSARVLTEAGRAPRETGTAS